MCGIVGYVGKLDCVSALMDGLSALAYRGYDSAGVAVWDGKQIVLEKTQGKLENLSKLLEQHPISGHCGIGHTRWATHGEPNYINSHPHTDDAKQIALVHNGIIENYKKLKDMLINRGCVFVSETDTEVVAQLLGTVYMGDPLAAVVACTQLLEGSFALAILFRDDPKTIYCACKDSPMVIGHSEKGSFIASDIPALLPYTRDVCFMDDRQIAIMRQDGISYYNEFGQSIEKTPTHIDWDVEAAKKGNYEHFMIKEICEQPIAFKKTLEQYANLKLGKLKADCFPWNKDEAKALKRIRIIACGSAYHSAMLGKKFIERIAKLPVDIDIASEFRYGDDVLSSDETLMLVSQSGETADTIAAMRKGRRNGMRTVAVCNAIGSTIAREVDNVLFTYAGPEIAVAATKSYLAQVTVQYLAALDLAQKRGYLSETEVKVKLDEMTKLPAAMQEILDNRERIQYFASRCFAVKHVFFIGRGIDYALSMEAALKLKEISYIHSEAYAAGELKHGTIALIEEGSLVVALATQNELVSKMASNMEEVKVRGANVLAVTSGDNSEVEGHCDESWSIPLLDSTLTPFCAIIPLQLLAYYMAIQKGCPVDQPRNLAKSVTVE